MINERNRSIDVVKGVLILLVVIGHVLVGPIDEHVLRYVIYSFHMPAFFFVSGYLLSLERLGQQNYGAMFSKYRKRMLMEWCIAWVIYMPYVLRDDGLSASVVLQSLRSPWYHLWFVPSLFVMVSLLWVLVRIVKNKEVLFVLLMGLGLLFYNLTNTDFAIGTTFDCRHLIFLAMGIYAHRLFTNIKTSLRVIIVYIIITTCLSTFCNIGISFFRTYMEVPLVGMLCLLGILPLVQQDRLRCKLIEYYGRHRCTYTYGMLCPLSD